MTEVPVILSDPARRELVNLWEQYAGISEDLADRVFHRLRQRILQLAHHPELGRARPEFNLPGLRSVAVNPHVIFYSIAEGPRVIIHRIVDGRRDLAALLRHE